MPEPHNLSRVCEYGVYDEVYLQTEIERVQQQGYAKCNTGLLLWINPFGATLRRPANRSALTDHFSFLSSLLASCIVSGSNSSA